MPASNFQPIRLLDADCCYKFTKVNGKQCRSRSVGFFRSQLIWIYTVCKGRVYPGSAGQGFRKENIFAYLLSGTLVGWQLQNKLFTKAGLLTGSSGQTFQIKLNYCSSAFFNLSASWTLFWSWMPDKLCHEKIDVSYGILVSLKDPAQSLHIYQV